MSTIHKLCSHPGPLIRATPYLFVSPVLENQPMASDQSLQVWQCPPVLSLLIIPICFSMSSWPLSNHCYYHASLCTPWSESTISPSLVFSLNRKTNPPSLPPVLMIRVKFVSYCITGLLVEVLREQRKQCLNYSKTQLPSAPRSKA